MKQDRFLLVFTIVLVVLGAVFIAPTIHSWLNRTLEATTPIPTTIPSIDVQPFISDNIDMSTVYGFGQAIDVIAANEDFLALPIGDGAGEAIVIRDLQTLEILYTIDSTTHVFPYQPVDCGNEYGGIASVTAMAFHWNYLAVGFDANADCLEDTTYPTLWVYEVREDGYRVVAQSRIRQSIYDIAWSEDNVYFTTRIGVSAEDGVLPEQVGVLNINSGAESIFDFGFGEEDYLLNFRIAAEDNHEGRVFLLHNHTEISEIVDGQLIPFSSGGHTGYRVGTAGFNTSGEHCGPEWENISDDEVPYQPEGCSASIWDIAVTSAGVISIGSDTNVVFRDFDGNIQSVYSSDYNWLEYLSFNTIEASSGNVLIGSSDGDVLQFGLDGTLIVENECGETISSNIALSSGFAFLAAHGIVCRFDLSQ